MPRKIGEHREGDVTVRWFEEGDDITIQRSQDAQGTLDHVAAANLAGLPTIDGLGRPVAEVPVVAAMEWAEKRGIPWEKLLYTNEYDAEFRRFCAEHQRLQYRAASTLHAVQ